MSDQAIIRTISEIVERKIVQPAQANNNQVAQPTKPVADKITNLIASYLGLELDPDN